MPSATEAQEKHPISLTCSRLRAEIASVTAGVRVLRGDVYKIHVPVLVDGPRPDIPEMHANVMLAYRHLEDARMRLGKVIQAFHGGVSVYDK